MSRVPRKCPVCRKVYMANPARLQWGRETTCSRACSYELRRAASAKVVMLACLGCGAMFTRPPSRSAGRGLGKYCARQCRDRNRAGRLHPQYLNGRAQEKRGPNWQAQKRAARKRDNDTCQDCGASNARHVHHIRPYRLFEDYRQANELSNLVTLCPACHRRRDADIQRAERRAA